MPTSTWTDSDGLDPFPSPNSMPKRSPRWEKWQALLEIAPELRKLQRSGPNEVPPPREISDFLFLGLIACMVDPRKREILRAVLFDLLNDDFIELLMAPEVEGDQ
jgi:hypothetical protein